MIDHLSIYNPPDVNTRELWFAIAWDMCDIVSAVKSIAGRIECHVKREKCSQRREYSPILVLK